MIHAIKLSGEIIRQTVLSVTDKNRKSKSFILAGICRNKEYVL